MRILLASNFFPPTHTAGTEKRTLGYATQLQAKGHDVQVICVGKWSEGEGYWNGITDEVYAGVPVRRINVNWALAPDPNRYLYRNPLIEQQLTHWLEQWQPEIMHITSCNTLSASIIAAGKAQQVPIVLTLTDFWFLCPRVTLLRSDGSLCDGDTTSWDCLRCLLQETKVYRGLRTIFPEERTAKLLSSVSKRSGLSRRRGLRGMALDMEERKSYLAQMIAQVDRLTAPSTALRDVFATSGTTQPVRVIHSGHDLSWLSTLPAKVPTSKFRIGYIGQIIPIKGVHTLIAAFLAAGLAGRAQLDIYGDTGSNLPYMAQLDALQWQQTDAIRFRKAFPHHQLGEVLSEIDLLVVPSLWHENNPRVIQEAFAGKTPVIAADVGGISEFVHHEVNGLLFERDNSADLAHQLQRIVYEPGLLGRLTAGIPSVKTVAEEVAEIEEIYQEVMAEHWNCTKTMAA